MVDYKADIKADLEERWHDLTSWVLDDVKKRWWKTIHEAYSQPHRKFHNLLHLHQMFQHYDQHKDSLQNGYACAYAIFFHNIVYDANAKDNASKSAAVFKEFSHETTLDQSNYIVDLIEATYTHCTDAHLNPAVVGSDDVHYFLDIDMAMLGASFEEYDKYRKDIREDFPDLDDPAYNRQRIKV